MGSSLQTFMKMTCEAMKVIRETLEMYNLQEKSMQVFLKITPTPTWTKISCTNVLWTQLG
jgi:hypothetical protein